MSIPDLTVLVREAPAQELPAIIAALEGAKAAAWARITAPASHGTSSDPESAGRLLVPTDAAAIAGVSTRWLLRNTRGLRFRRDLSRKNVRFEEQGFRRWLTARRA
jgi:hypothetical protein